MVYFLKHFIALSIISTFIVFPIFAQDRNGWIPADYVLSGDLVSYTSDELGGRHATADGNVRFNYTIDAVSWQLSAGHVEYLQVVDETGVVIQQTAVARDNISINGPGITLSVPGTVSMDLLAGHLLSDSGDIRLVFENGELATDSLEINSSPGTDSYEIRTAINTSITYSLENLSNGLLPGAPGEGGSIFGSLQFDFNQLTVDTERTIMTIVEGQPETLQCPDESSISSVTNTLVMPSFSLAFDPPTLTGQNGVVLEISNISTVYAAEISLIYPPDGGMTVELEGHPATQNEISDLPDKVYIIHPDATFSADRISITLRSDGTQSISALGNVKFEIPIEVILKESDEQESVSGEVFQ